MQLPWQKTLFACHIMKNKSLKSLSKPVLKEKRFYRSLEREHFNIPAEMVLNSQSIRKHKGNDWLSQ